MNFQNVKGKKTDQDPDPLVRGTDLDPYQNIMDPNTKFHCATTELSNDVKIRLLPKILICITYRVPDTDPFPSE
jgi:hypothetical protein